MSDLRRRTRSGREPESDGSPTAKRQKTSGQGPKEPKGDLALLDSGEFSDAAVTCDGVRIEIHKAVVVPRSGFFKGALAGGFIEGETGCVTVEKRTVKQLRSTLHYIYGRKFEKEDELAMADCVDLVKLGDYFLVDGMVRHASRLLWQRLSSMLKTTATCTGGPAAVYRVSNPYQNVKAPRQALSEADFDKHFAAAVEAAYGPDAPPGNPAQRMLADFVWAARGVLLGDPAVEALNKRFPELGSQVFTVLNEGPKSGFLPKRKSGVLEGVPEWGPSDKSCAGCGRQWRWDRADKYPVYIDPTSLQLQATRGFCRGCVSDKEKSDKEWKPWPDPK